MTAVPVQQPPGSLCRDCFHLFYSADAPAICPQCNKRRLVHHEELTRLEIAHIDCDAFYASVEKRDDPSLADKPVIVGGGGNRGVVSAACYTARIYGVHSAMPMYRARKLCPQGVVIPPDMAKYQREGRAIRAKFEALTPLVEPLSVDEAFLDLTGTERLHKACPAVLLAKLAAEIERDIGLSVSIGLAPNKFLAKLGSDLDKPRGFSVIGESDREIILAPMPIKRIYGVGKRTSEKLAKDGLTTIGQLQQMDHGALVRRYGDIGNRLYYLSRGEDVRAVKPGRKAKSVSTETTFERDIYDREKLEAILWRCAVKVSAELKAKNLAGQTVTLKLKTGGHRIVTRAHTMDGPTQLAQVIFDVASHMLAGLCNGTGYRLLGVGISQFRPLAEADQPSLVDERRNKQSEAERAADKLKKKFGEDIVVKGRILPSA